MTPLEYVLQQPRHDDFEVNRDRSLRAVADGGEQFFVKSRCRRLRVGLQVHDLSAGGDVVETIPSEVLGSEVTPELGKQSLTHLGGATGSRHEVQRRLTPLIRLSQGIEPELLWNCEIAIKGEVIHLNFELSSAEDLACLLLVPAPKSGLHASAALTLPKSPYISHYLLTLLMNKKK